MADLSFDDLVPQQGASPAAAPATAAAAPATSFDDLVPQYRGSVLPFSTDAQGNNYLDWGAGIPGMIGRTLGAAASGATAPGAAYFGTMPTPYSGAGATTDPSQAINRAIDFASVFSPTSAATRAGELVPGTAWYRAGAPTAQQLKATAGAQYNAARNSGLAISGDAVGNMASGLQDSLQANYGIIAKTAPKTFSVLDELANPPSGGYVTVDGLEAARRGLNGLRLEGGTEGLAAGHAVRGLDDFVSTLGSDSFVQTATGPASTALVPGAQAGAGTPGVNPADVALLRNARGNYAAAQRSNDLTGTLDTANTGILEQAQARAEASHSGRNLDNAIRQRVATFLQSPENLAGWSQPEIDALKGVVAGGPIQNASRLIGNVLGGGGGLGHLAGMAAGAALGSHLGGEVGAGLGAAVPATFGTAAKWLENALSQWRLNAADQIVRQNSPLYQQGGAISLPAMLQNNAAMRSMLPGFIAPQPAPMSPIPIAALNNWA